MYLETPSDTKDDKFKWADKPTTYISISFKSHTIQFLSQHINSIECIPLIQYVVCDFFSRVCVWVSGANKKRLASKTRKLRRFLT